MYARTATVVRTSSLDFNIFWSAFLTGRKIYYEQVEARGHYSEHVVHQHLFTPLISSSSLLEYCLIPIPFPYSNPVLLLSTFLVIYPSNFHHTLHFHTFPVAVAICDQYKFVSDLCDIEWIQLAWTAAFPIDIHSPSLPSLSDFEVFATCFVQWSTLIPTYTPSSLPSSA